MSHPAILYASHHSPSGYGVAGRRLITALDGIGATVSWTPLVFNLNNPLLPDDALDEGMALNRFRGADIDPDVVVLHTIPEFLPALQHLRRPGVPLVCHTVWEIEELQRHWPGLLNYTDGVIVPTEWNAQAFRRAGVTVPIGVVPHVACSDPVDAAWLDEPPIEAAGQFMVGAITTWSMRKAPWRAVETFAQAFSPEDRALFVLCTKDNIETGEFHPPGPPHLEYRTSWWTSQILFQHHPTGRVHLSTTPRTFAQIAGFHRRLDCWLTLPHSEGWDLGTFDAAAAGRPVITTAYGAPLEYLDPEASFLIDGPMVPFTPIPHDLDVDLSRATWMAPDIGLARAALRSVRDNPAEVLAKAAAQGERMRADYAPHRVAQHFLDALGDMGLR